MIHSVAILLLLANASVPEYGALRVVAQPGTQVVWEGVDLGAVGPEGVLSIEGIPLGQYNLTLRKSGFRQHSSNVEVGPGRATVSWTLEAIEPASPAPPERPKMELVPDEPEATPPAIAAPPVSVAPAAELPADRRDALGFWVIGLALITAGLWWVLRSRDQPTGRPSDGSEAADATPRTESVDDASKLPEPMLEELRRREAAIEERDVVPPAAANAEVIDIVDFEVIEEET